jgi:PAS domain-containing protein
MVPSGLDEAVVVLDRNGRYIDANQAALDLLGVSLGDLLGSPSSRFSIEPTGEGDQAALTSEWSDTGHQPLLGTAGLRRGDGTTIRVSYAIERSEDGFRARLSPVGGAADAPSTVYSVGSVLREWRAAERSLSALDPGSSDWSRVADEIEMLRSRYQGFFREIRSTG